MLQFRIVSIFSFCLLLNSSSFAQITQTIRGRVFDAETQKPLLEAAVVLDAENLKTSTNTEGVFRLEKVPVGRHILRVSFVGFETLVVPDILLESGKEIVLDIALKSLNINTETLVVTAQRERYFDPINGIRNEKLIRYPATFNDPARLITYLPGAATTNDQGNNISVRGSSPNMVQWYLNGAEVVNPNHLSNAGTRNDQATVNGGGVLIPGFNVMAGTQLYKGAMSSDMGGALTSVMDIGLRKGNNERQETQISLGLVGTELGTEGAFSKNSKASYLVHYRYSTIGLLSKMGVPLGDEEIQFQDLSVNLNFPTQKAGTFNVFGIYGASENLFTHLPNRTEWKVDKDSQDITYTNKMGAIGVRHELSMGQRGRLSTVVAYSALENERSAVGFSLNNVPVSVRSANNKPSKLFLKSVYNYTLNAKQNLKMAFVARKDDFSYLQTYKAGQTNDIRPANRSSWWLQPSVEWQGKWTENWSTNIGVRLVQWNNLEDSKQNQTNFEPTANIQYLFANNSNLTFGYSLQSQMVSPVFSVPAEIFSTTVFNIESITKSHNINAAYQFRLSKNIIANIEAYFQPIFKASFSTLNGYDAVYGNSNQNITGRNAGIEIDVQEQLNKGFYWRANVSLYDAKYKNGSQWFDTHFNGHYISNALVGKEWAMGTLKNRFLGVNVHTILRGGYFDFYAQQNLKDYFRTDLSVYWKRSHRRYSSTVQLDLQNVTNQQNEGWQYRDQRQGKILTQYQLGLIPNLAYKVEF